MATLTTYNDLLCVDTNINIILYMHQFMGNQEEDYKNKNKIKYAQFNVAILVQHDYSNNLRFKFTKGIKKMLRFSNILNFHCWN